ncbi:MAG TPA: metallophosphoesterase [archaeon]|nr:metallophosphoesterase [archaeon]
MVGKIKLLIGFFLSLLIVVVLFLVPTPLSQEGHNILHIEPLANDVNFSGAGDIASCESVGDEKIAQLLDVQNGTVFTLGDNVYEAGSASEFSNCYEPSWGRHKLRTMPSVGNHEYYTSRAKGYYDYFGSVAGDSSRGYYSYDIGKWHAIVLNSNCASVGGCLQGSAQYRWLLDDLELNKDVKCTVAYFHHPRYSSGSEHGDSTFMQDIWAALYNGGTDIVLAGHDHDYERFAPMDSLGNINSQGMRSFVVGAGGKSLRPFGNISQNSEVQEFGSFGILRLELKPSGYEWEFISVQGQSFTDSGSGQCR